MDESLRLDILMCIRGFEGTVFIHRRERGSEGYIAMVELLLRDENTREVLRDEVGAANEASSEAVNLATSAAAPSPKLHMLETMQ